MSSKISLCCLHRLNRDNTFRFYDIFHLKKSLVSKKSILVLGHTFRKQLNAEIVDPNTILGMNRLKKASVSTTQACGIFVKGTDLCSACKVTEIQDKLLLFCLDLRYDLKAVEESGEFQLCCHPRSSGPFRKLVGES